MVGPAMDRGGLKDSKNAPNSFFFRKSAEPGFDVWHVGKFQVGFTLLWIKDYPGLS